MSGYNSNFRVNRSGSGFTNADFNSVFVRKDYFNEGGLWSWGGAVGDNTTVSKSSPVQTIARGTNWKSVSAGKATFAVKTDGTAWAWGCESAFSGGGTGALGDNTTVSKSSPVQIVGSATNWKCVVVGEKAVFIYFPYSPGTTMGIKTDGTLWMWGAGAGGVLGDNTTVSKSSPVQTIAGGNNWMIAGGSNRVSAAIKTDGTLWTWGHTFASAFDKNGGLLGDNTTIRKSSPVQTIAGGTNWKSVCAYAGVAATKTDGTLWLWGMNGRGRLGNNSTVNASSPVQTVAGGTNWRQVSIGDYNAAAIKTDGTLWVWGYGQGGVLGTNSTISQSSPVQTVSGGTNWRLVTVGKQSNAAAIKTDGTLWIWGSNLRGNLGNNSTVNASSPVQTVAGGTNWRDVSASYNMVAIRENCW